MKLNFIVNALLALTVVEAKVIMLIRHGEKIDDDHIDLSPQGQARAECLIEAFGTNGYYVSPQRIYAQCPSEDKQSTRPRDTVTPLAKSLGLEVDLTYIGYDYEALAGDLKVSQEQVILVCWANDNIPNIAQGLGIPNAPNWKGKIFDDVWVLTDDPNSFVRDPSNKPTISKTYSGTEGLDMYVVKENVSKCMNQKLGITTTTDDDTDESNELNNTNDSSASDKVMTNIFTTLAGLFTAFVYLF
ncbi:hypothetical protein BCR32DRAFT_329250 [Anaeromyces robustus]|jgi:hypothetical protein|uniref:Phosphoglycerate mutase family protein n=1 Tax=Anaeromyces robustus TaxID=1754192 RepID=A0A1Y1WT08_9FUNG|nr:hypothetical protein BCR32DRAFT_329250 [Anaeromyces robustus]|eukprot:ORX76667.1 hypothetical protein BCR32DRAFT_329250 [Anaeromyces robustus]